MIFVEQWILHTFWVGKRFTEHYTWEEEGQIYVSLLVQLCDCVAPLILILCTIKRETNLFGYIQNIFILIIPFLSEKVKMILNI